MVLDFRNIPELIASENNPIAAILLKVEILTLNV